MICALLILFVLFLTIALFLGMQIIPQQEAWVVQRLGKFNRILGPGPNWTIPFVDNVIHRHSLKEEAIDVPEQTAITQDNVSVIVDGIVYVRIDDPFKASYGVKHPVHATVQLVQTIMRSEIGKIALDKTFEERETLNGKIVEATNQASNSWGIKCLRYEIRDIKMPEEIRKAMELQMTAERQKRAKILESEGLRQAQINLGEAAQIDRVNRALGEAEAINLLAKATARSIEEISKALGSQHGEQAASLSIAEKYIESFRQLAKEGNAILLPANLQHPSAMIAEAMAIYDQVKKRPLVSAEKTIGSLMSKN